MTIQRERTYRITGHVTIDEIGRLVAELAACNPNASFIFLPLGQDGAAHERVIMQTNPSNEQQQEVVRGVLAMRDLQTQEFNENLSSRMAERAADQQGARREYSQLMAQAAARRQQLEDDLYRAMGDQAADELFIDRERRGEHGSLTAGRTSRYVAGALDQAAAQTTQSNSAPANGTQPAQPATPANDTVINAGSEQEARERAAEEWRRAQQTKGGATPTAGDAPHSARGSRRTGAGNTPAATPAM